MIAAVLLQPLLENRRSRACASPMQSLPPSELLQCAVSTSRLFVPPRTLRRHPRSVERQDSPLGRCPFCVEPELELSDHRPSLKGMPVARERAWGTSPLPKHPFSWGSRSMIKPAQAQGAPSGSMASCDFSGQPPPGAGPGPRPLHLGSRKAGLGVPLRPRAAEGHGAQDRIT